MLDENIFRWLVIVATGSIVVSGMEITYEQHARFPKLFHLDNYHDCLGPGEGLYCVGTFHITSLKGQDATYELMKKYSQDVQNFNRTLIHRGWCVSSRCPSLYPKHNITERFKHCMAHYMRRHSFKTNLIEFSYCRTHDEEYDYMNTRTSLQKPYSVFLCTIIAVIAMNVIGTSYDVMKSSDINKSKVLRSWSTVANWSQLVGPYPDGDPRLAALLPVEAFRVIMIVLVIFTHAGCIHDSLYIANPKLVEEMSHHWIMMSLQNGTSSIQLFLMLSSFLLAQSILTYSPLNFKKVAKLLFKRIFRIMPVYLLVIGFAATWWPLLNNGPLWHSTVANESQICHQKFWSHVFFFHNFIEPQRHCLAPTWFLAVDMQLYILGCIVMLFLAKVKSLALHLRKNVRHMYQNEPSFYEYYINPLGSIPTMIVGLFLAHLNHQLHEIGFQPADHKLLIYACQMTFSLIPVWTTSGHLWRDLSSREFSAFYIGLERPVTLVLGGILLFGAYNGTSKKEISKITHSKTNNGHGFLKNVFTWRIWYPLGRSSLSVVMLHWCVNLMIKAPTLQPITSTALEMVKDTVAITFFSYLLAIPITLLVEIPFIQLYSAITSSSKRY